MASASAEERALLEDLARFREAQETRNERILNWVRLLLLGTVLVGHGCMALTHPNPPPLAAYVPVAVAMAICVGLFGRLRDGQPYWPARKYLITHVEVIGATTALVFLRPAVEPVIMGFIPMKVYLLLLLFSALRYDTRLVLLIGAEELLLYETLFAPGIPSPHRLPASVASAVELTAGTLMTSFIVGSLLALSRQTVLKQRHSDLKSAFVGQVSHELSQPLTAIRGYCDLLLDGLRGEMPERQRAVVSSIHANARAIQSLVGDLLDISRIEAGRLELRLDRVRLAEVLRSARETVEPQAQQQGLTLTERVDGDAFVEGDYQRLHQVFVNLLGNAVKFTPAGEVGIALRCAPPWAVVEVVDTGPGIPEESLPRIFDEFWKGPGGGTGLGLNISKRLVEMHAGRISARSVVGQGSTFVVELPMR
ncbi:MAG: HAMP domain-containing sensor histidine kinase [Candidatus Eremiobacterota bacterium]